MINTFAKIPNVLMSLSELSDNCAHRFIVCEVSEKCEVNIQVKKIICVKNISNFPTHNAILQWLKSEVLLTFDVKCIGGGVINFNLTNKQITISGKSTNFGPEPNRAETTEYFKIFLPDFMISQ